MIINSSENVHVGNYKEMHCIADITERINPLAVNITWTGPNGAITNDNRLTITPTVSNGTKHISTLQFSYLSEDDEGLYECNVAVFEMNKVEFFPLINFISKYSTFFLCINVRILIVSEMCELCVILKCVSSVWITAFDS